MHQHCMVYDAFGVLCVVCSSYQGVTPTFGQLMQLEFPLHLIAPGATTVTIVSGVKYAVTDASYTSYHWFEGVFDLDQFPRTIGELVNYPEDKLLAARRRAEEQEVLAQPSLRRRDMSPIDWEHAYKSGFVVLHVTVDGTFTKQPKGPFICSETTMTLCVDEGRIELNA